MSLLRIKQADGSWENIPAIKGADGVDGKDGAVQYTAGRYIQIDEDTQTINCTVKIGDLVIIDAVPVKDSTNVVSSGGVYDALETKADKTEIAGLGSEAGFITNSVEDLKNYYKKSETYSQDEVNSLLGNLTRLTLQVVQELPEVGTEHIIYLVPNDESGNNVFEEWIFVQSKWEMIGTTEVDLNNYYTKEEVDNILTQSKYIYDFDLLHATYYLNNSLSLDNDTKERLRILLNQILTDNNADRHAILLHNSSNTSRIIQLFPRYNLDLAGLEPKEQFYQEIRYVGLLVVDSKISSFVVEHFELDIRLMSLTGTYIDSIDTAKINWNYSYLLGSKNTYAYTPYGDYNPATKKYVDDKILDAIPQKSTMPTASADYLDKIYQYIGEDTEEFTKGFFYQCISETVDDTVTYSWSELKFNADNESVECVYNLTENKTSEPFKGVNVGLGNSNVPGFRAALKQSLNAGHKNFMINIRFSKTGEKLELRCTIDGETISISCWKAWYIYKGSYASFYNPINVGGISTISEIDTADYFIRLNFKGNCVSVPDSSRLITKDNTTEFTPTSDYHPATKKYVDDTVANAGGGEGGDSSNSIPYLYVSTVWLPNSSPTVTLASNELATVSEYITNSLNKVCEIAVKCNGVTPGVLHTEQPIAGTETNVAFGGLYSTKSATAVYFYTLSVQGTWTDGVFTATYGTVGRFTNIQKYDFLAKNNTTSFTPTADYHPATKKYVDEAVAAGGGGGDTDLSDYYNKEEVDAKVAPLVSATDVLTKTNTTEYIPASAYHPATKQYVDQTVASSGAITEESDPTVPLHVKNITEDMISKWNNAPTEEDVTNAATAAVNGAGFVKSETDPAFKASAAAGIASSDIDNWNGKADLADIDSALISTLGGTYSTDLAANPIYNTTEITMTEELLELATNVKDAIAAGKPPKLTLKVTFNNSTEDLHFIPKDYSVDEGYCRYIAPVYNHKDDNDFRSFSCSILLAQLRFYNLNATNKYMSIYYTDATNLHTINEANWVNGGLTEDSTPYIGLGIYANSGLSLITTLDLAYLSHKHRFKEWSGTNAPTTSRDKLVLGMLGNKLYIDFGSSGTSFTKGYYQTFSEMMDAIKVTDETSDDYGKYILAENFLTIDSGWWLHYDLDGRRLIDEHGYYSNIIYTYYNDIYDRVYLRGSESGEIIVAKLVSDDNYVYNGVTNQFKYRVTLEIDPNENKALLNSTTDLGRIRGMTSKQSFDCDDGDGLLPTIHLDSDGYIERVGFTQVNFN